MEYYRIEERRKATILRMTLNPTLAIRLCDYLCKCKFEVAEYRYNSLARQSIIIIDNANEQKLKETLDFYIKNENL